MRNSPLVTHHFQVNQCARQSQWMWNGREWGEVSAASLHQTVCHSQLPSLLRQNIWWMFIAADRTDGQRGMQWASASVVGCVWEADGWADAHVGGRISLLSPLISLPPRRPPPPAWRWLTGPVWSQNTDGRAGDPVHGGARWSPGIRLHTKTTLLQYYNYEQFHAVTKKVNIMSRSKCPQCGVGGVLTNQHFTYLLTGMERDPLVGLMLAGQQSQMHPGMTIRRRRGNWF